MIPERVGLNLLAHYIIAFCFLGKVTQYLPNEVSEQIACHLDDTLDVVNCIHT